MPVLSEFGGIIPRMSWHALPMTNATIAHDIKLRNGKIEPWRERSVVHPGTLILFNTEKK